MVCVILKMFLFRFKSKVQCLFEPRMIEFENKVVYSCSLWDRDVGEEIVEQANEQIVRTYLNDKHVWLITIL